MIIRKAPNPRGWTTIPNRTIEDATLSFRARGILHYLLSRPDGWETDSDRLSRIGLEGREAVRTALRELETARYMVRHRKQGDRGRWATHTYVYDEPQPNPDGDVLPDFDPEASPPPAENHPVDEPVDNPVDENAENADRSTGYRASENRALLTTNSTIRDQAPSATTGPATPPPVSNLRRGSSSPSGLLGEGAGAAGRSPASSGSALTGEGASLSLSPADLDAFHALAVLEPGIQMFALRAHLLATMHRPVTFTEAALAAHAAASTLAEGSRLAIRDVISWVLEHGLPVPFGSAAEGENVPAAAGRPSQPAPPA